MNLRPAPPTPTRSPDDDVLARVVTAVPTPLLPGEEETDYDAIAVNIVVASEPRDAIEEYLNRDVIDLTWEILRLRRLKAGILRASMSAGVGAILDDVGFPYEDRDALAGRWAAGDESARKKVDALLTKAGLTIDDVTAKTLSSQMDNFERVDRMLSSAEARRNNALREIDIAKRLARLFAERTTKSKMLNSATSRRAKSPKSPRLDQRSTALRKPRQRDCEHRPQDEGGQGSIRQERVTARIGCFHLERALIGPASGSDCAQNRRPECGA